MESLIDAIKQCVKDIVQHTTSRGRSSLSVTNRILVLESNDRGRTESCVDRSEVHNVLAELSERFISLIIKLLYVNLQEGRDLWNVLELLEQVPSRIEHLYPPSSLGGNREAVSAGSTMAALFASPDKPQPRQASSATRTATNTVDAIFSTPRRSNGNATAATGVRSPTGGHTPQQQQQQRDSSTAMASPSPRKPVEGAGAVYNMFALAPHRFKFTRQSVKLVSGTFSHCEGAIRCRVLIRLLLNQGRLTVALELLSRFFADEELPLFYDASSRDGYLLGSERRRRLLLDALAPLGEETLAEMESAIIRYSVDNSDSAEADGKAASKDRVVFDLSLFIHLIDDSWNDDCFRLLLGNDDSGSAATASSSEYNYCVQAVSFIRNRRSTCPSLLSCYEHCFNYSSHAEGVSGSGNSNDSTTATHAVGTSAAPTPLVVTIPLDATTASVSAGRHANSRSPSEIGSHRRHHHQHSHSRSHASASESGSLRKSHKRRSRAHHHRHGDEDEEGEREASTLSSDRASRVSYLIEKFNNNSLTSSTATAPASRISRQEKFCRQSNMREQDRYISEQLFPILLATNATAAAASAALPTLRAEEEVEEQEALVTMDELESATHEAWDLLKLFYNVNVRVAWEAQEAVLMANEDDFISSW